MEIQEKSPQRRWKAKKKALGDGESQRKRLSETVKAKEKGSRRRWKSKKKALRDGGSQRKRLSETVEVKKFLGVAYKPSF